MNAVPWTHPGYGDLTLSQMAEFRLGREYHVVHAKSWYGFEECDHEVCEDARELVLQLEALEAKEPVT